ncbi:hypothetical protein BHE74_00010332 [Ensete ventricosum]|nr:hypothetical protein GW17_00028142 [Ensete ventricosum]RWW81288.1 hypothetical protein BHE74_00010332 [Ensete ventricosum]
MLIIALDPGVVLVQLVQPMKEEDDSSGKRQRGSVGAIGQGRRDEDEGSDCCCCMHCWEETPATSALAKVGLGGRWLKGRGNDVVSDGGAGKGLQQQVMRLRKRARDDSVK